MLERLTYDAGLDQVTYRSDQADGPTGNKVFVVDVARGESTFVADGFLDDWLDEHTLRSATLAVNDIGAIAFFSRRPVVDLMGLVTPEIEAYRREGEAGVIRYIGQRCPDYVVIFPTWFPRLAERRDLLVRVYAVRLERIEVSGGPEMVVYRLARCAV